MNLSRNALFCLEIRLGIALFVFSVLLYRCSPEKNNTESMNKGTQLLPYSSQGNESKEHENSKNKMVPAIMTGDGKLQRLDNYQGGNFYAFKVDVEEGVFFRKYSCSNFSSYGKKYSHPKYSGSITR